MKMLEEYFKVKENSSTVRTEMIAGVTTFMAMAYILMVNSAMFAELGEVSYSAIYIATAISAVAGTMLMAFMVNLPIGLASGMGVKGSVLWGIVGGAVIYYVLGVTVPGFYDGFAESLNFNPLIAFVEWKDQAWGQLFIKGFDFSEYLLDHSTTDLVLVVITSALAMCMTDMFDTLGTLYGACARGNMLTEEGEVPNF